MGKIRNQEKQQRENQEALLNNMFSHTYICPEIQKEVTVYKTTYATGAYNLSDTLIVEAEFAHDEAPMATTDQHIRGV